MPSLSIPDFLPYVLAILALLLLWEMHDIQVRAGRIKAVDFWDRSGIRLFIHATPTDINACPGCRETNGLVFLPSFVAKEKITAAVDACTNPSGCRCTLVGLYGGWPEAAAVLDRLKDMGGSLRLTEEELDALFKGRWQRAPGASADRVSVRLLQALRDEDRDPEASIFGYRFVIDHAQGERDLSFLVPSYFRLTDLLERLGRQEDALPIVERFLKRYDKTSPCAASDAELSMMSARRIRLIMTLKAGVKTT